MTTKPLNSTSFSVTWQQVPPDHVHGIVLGYKVLLENMADGSLLFTEIVNVNQTQITLNGSREVSTFCVRVLAFTRKGDGKESSCTEAWTWSEGKMFNDCDRQFSSTLPPHSVPFPLIYVCFSRLGQLTCYTVGGRGYAQGQGDMFG